jgi:hypothetical protein
LVREEQIMGYTHYWDFNAYITEKGYKKALRECRKVIRNSPVPLANWSGEGNPLLRNGFNFNGVGDDCHENLRMGKEPILDEWFCKTERKSYDVVVVACLCILQDCLGEGINVSSDGDPHEWEEGKALACEITGRDVRIPGAVRRCEGMQESYREEYAEEHPEYGEFHPLELG